MKKTLAIIAAALLSGCAGLSINADFYGSYRSDVPMGARGETVKQAPAPTSGLGLKL